MSNRADLEWQLCLQMRRRRGRSRRWWRRWRRWRRRRRFPGGRALLCERRVADGPGPSLLTFSLPLRTALSEAKTHFGDV
ncbi:Hypothetical predicted protein [Marmota monax]|uniref:Uncharacterized protein n=1 Tax=Marmota monax TaxID=9995 RepID=A0A5E4BNI7_MARMO|nr:Hypothetical predicted protein [Marmota monax]